mmetsp:Transcript_700/g.905  ORF Transcript_700/g.905 Transcript_700/m.905 type:complete len:222 (-) Transcript_700:38-703(-)
MVCSFIMFESVTKTSSLTMASRLEDGLRTKTSDNRHPFSCLRLFSNSFLFPHNKKSFPFRFVRPWWGYVIEDDDFSRRNLRRVVPRFLVVGNMSECVVRKKLSSPPPRLLVTAQSWFTFEFKGHTKDNLLLKFDLLESDDRDWQCGRVAETNKFCCRRMMVIIPITKTRPSLRKDFFSLFCCIFPIFYLKYSPPMRCPLENWSTSFRLIHKRSAIYVRIVG